MANQIITALGLTREALRILNNMLSFSKNIYQGYDSGNYGNASPKEGDTLNVRLPNKYLSTTGSALDVQDVKETTIPVTLTTQRHIDIEFTSKELTLDIDDFSRTYLVPAMSQLANDIDFDGLKEYQNVYNHVGTPGVTPKTALVILKGGMVLNNYAVPRDGNRFAVIDPMAEAYMVDALKGLFQDSSNIASQYRQGMMGRGLGFNFEMDQNIHTHATGTYNTGDDPAVKLTETLTEGISTLKMYNFDVANPHLNPGDIFTIDQVYGVNPKNKQTLPTLQTFTVTAPTVHETPNVIVQFSPAIYFEETPEQNVNKRPDENLEITFPMHTESLYPMNLLYHKEAFCMVTADLQLPGGVDFAAREVSEGISMRIVRQYDINSDSFPCRIDVLYGHKTIRPEMACRLIG